LEFQVRARNRIHEDKAELSLEALRNQHLSSSKSEEVAPKILSHVLFGGLDFTQQHFAQVGFNLL